MIDGSKDPVIDMTMVSDEKDKKLGTVDDDVVLVSKYQPVKLLDLKTLENGQWLNDTIIDWYLSHLKEEILPQDDREGIHIFSALFYACLNPEKRHREKIPDREKRHLAVANWTKTINIFKKNLVVFPICKDCHWFLILVVKPGMVAYPNQKNNGGEPMIIVLDSLGRSQNQSVKMIREYLAEEWRTRMSPSCGGRIISFSEKQIKTIIPKKVIVIVHCKSLLITFNSV